MNMQFAAPTEKESREIQESLFEAGHIWASGGKKYFNCSQRWEVTYIRTDGQYMAYNSGSAADVRLFPMYVLVDGLFYKEGQEPKPANPFKVGDKVVCIRPEIVWLAPDEEAPLTLGGVYTVERLHGVTDVILDSYKWSFSTGRFELAPPEQLVVFDELPVDTRPPLGLRPRFIADMDYVALDQARLVEILEAMLRYAKADKPIPDGWDNEFDDTRERLNAYYEPEDDFLTI